MPIWMRPDKDKQRSLNQLEKVERRHSAVTRAALAGALRSNITPEEAGVDLSAVEWPKLAEYDYYHGKWTSQLVVHIGGTLGLKPEELKVARTAALLHDLGRREDWRKPDPDHARRSAELADGVMKRSSWWSQQALREQVCRLIAAHTLEGPPPSDPLRVVLWDAECFEAARLAPNTAEGAYILKARLGRVITDWARRAEHQRRWRDHRGWSTGGGAADPFAQG